MITLVLSADGTPSVWNPDDWLTLREQHRIVGSLIGALGHLPHQDTFKGLPFTLLPEEATFLLERKIARLVVFPSLKSAPQEPVKEAYHKHLETSYNEQVEHMRNERKRQLELVMDKIIEGRRKKLLGLATKKQKKGKVKKENDADASEEASKEEEDENIPIIDRDVVLQEEMAKIPPLSRDNTLIQTFTAFPWLREDDACPAKWTFPRSKLEKLRYKVFKDLWERGYFISIGHKFGGDFLVYPGDPMKFHSQFIVTCLEYNSKMNALQLASSTRVATSVRKGLVLASVKPGSDKLFYQTVYWATVSGEGPV